MFSGAPDAPYNSYPKLASCWDPPALMFSGAPNRSIQLLPETLFLLGSAGPRISHLRSSQPGKICWDPPALGYHTCGPRNLGRFWEKIIENIPRTSGEDALLAVVVAPLWW